MPSFVGYLKTKRKNQLVYQLFMERKKGNLHQTIVLSKNLLDFEIIHKFYKKMLYGLSFLQCLGLSHRDLKPENILCDPENVTYKSEI